MGYLSSFTLERYLLLHQQIFLVLLDFSNSLWLRKYLKSVQNEIRRCKKGDIKKMSY